MTKLSEQECLILQRIEKKKHYVQSKDSESRISKPFSVWDHSLLMWIDALSQGDFPSLCPVGIKIFIVLLVASYPRPSYVFFSELRTGPARDTKRPLRSSAFDGKLETNHTCLICRSYKILLILRFLHGNTVNPGSAADLVSYRRKRCFA